RELDHVIPWPKGKTTATQLKGLCSWHHHRKHDNYTVTLDSDGTTTWTTPQGRVHTTHPHQY
ncbi:HNH endonuclease, partial [Kutzneria kofuensis]